MDRADLAELHSITPIANLPSIMKHGIVSNRRSRALEAVSIALEAVQEKRDIKKVPGGRMLHEYVNLYISTLGIQCSSNASTYMRRSACWG
ncbi:MAG: DarT ssDNA thymidine ADP-ribosyltransferase family protein [Stellaceae bacterium]